MERLNRRGLIPLYVVVLAVVLTVACTGTGGDVPPDEPDASLEVGGSETVSQPEPDGEDEDVPTVPLDPGHSNAFNSLGGGSAFGGSFSADLIIGAPVPVARINSENYGTDLVLPRR